VDIKAKLSAEPTHLITVHNVAYDSCKYFF